MAVNLGNLEVQIVQVGRGQTKGDTIAWLPEQRILFAGDLVEYQSTPYAGDCYFREWPHTLDTLAEFNAEKMVPGRGPALKSADEVRKGLRSEERRVGKEWVSTGRSRGSPSN